MKIRMDFVTNSSSSCFICVSMLNEDYLKLIKGTDLENFTIYDDIRSNKMDSCKPALYDFYNDYLMLIETEESFGIAELREYLRYLKDKYDIDCTEEDLRIYKSCSGYGDFMLNSLSKYGIEYKYLTITELYERNKRINCDIVFNDDMYIEPEFLDLSVVKDIIKKFIDQYGSDSGTRELVNAYYEAFEDQGQTRKEIIEALGVYAKYLD